MVQKIKTIARTQAAKSPRAASESRKRPAGKADLPASLPVKPASPSMVLSLARQLQSWSGSILGGMGTATDVALTLAQSQNLKPGPKAAVDKAAALLRDLRQAAGLTIDDLGEALDLEDPSFLKLVEKGSVGLPFDLILRLAAVLGRNDPVGFVLQMTRSYNPKTWKTLEALGIGKLLVQAGREREFANIYRSNDAARSLSDADFAAALGFADAAFKTAIAFQGKHGRGAKHKDDHEAGTENTKSKPVKTHS
ncbi:MAG: helix-turn-helix domain-containing protein [Burkholderiaceae bacterium]|nr:helix-turn-helix domain-containing protein [Burkholderiaceae bacterium]